MVACSDKATTQAGLINVLGALHTSALTFSAIGPLILLLALHISLFTLTDILLAVQTEANMKLVRPHVLGALYASIQCFPVLNAWLVQLLSHSSPVLWLTECFAFAGTSLWLKMV